MKAARDKCQIIAQSSDMQIQGSSAPPPYVQRHHSEPYVQRYHSDSFITKEVTIEQCMQPALKKPVMKSQFYESFWNDYQKKGFNYVCKKYLNGDLKGKIKRLIKGLFIKIGLWENLKTLQKQK